MRYNEVITELNMGKSALKSFINSEATKGALSGFEAELIFPGALKGYTRTIDLDRKVHSIDGALKYIFSQEDEQTTRETYGKKLYRDHAKWVQEQFDVNADEILLDYLNKTVDVDEEIIQYMVDVMNMDEDEAEYSFGEQDQAFKKAQAAINKQLMDRVKKMRKTKDATYEKVYTDFELMDDSVHESAYFAHYEINNIGDFVEVWGIDVSDRTHQNFNRKVATKFANKLKKDLGITVKVLDGYHAEEKQNGIWYIEPDSSIKTKDDTALTMEIVSPALPFGEIIPKMHAFFRWATKQGAIANRSTGFHMSISYPDYNHERLDQLKLGLFIGDKHVLKQFGRNWNRFAEPIMDRIAGEVYRDESLIDVERDMGKLINSSFEGTLGQIASREYGKYFSVNPKSGYVEFRSAGGVDYIEKLDVIEHTLMRFAQGLYVAINPDAERVEYAKKLYKFLKSQSTKAEMDTTILFSKYASGLIGVDELKDKLSKLHQEKTKRSQQKRYRISLGDDQYTVRATSQEEAINNVRRKYPPDQREFMGDEDFTVEVI